MDWDFDHTHEYLLQVERYLEVYFEMIHSACENKRSIMSQQYTIYTITHTLYMYVYSIYKLLLKYMYLQALNITILY